MIGPFCMPTPGTIWLQTGAGALSLDRPELRLSLNGTNRSARVFYTILPSPSTGTRHRFHNQRRTKKRVSESG